MHVTNLRKVGGSVMLAVPPALLDVLNVSAGAKVGLVVDNGRLVVKPVSGPRYSMAELLLECDGLAEMSQEDGEWLNDAPVGRELL